MSVTSFSILALTKLRPGSSTWTEYVGRYRSRDMGGHSTVPREMVCKDP